MKHFKRFMIGCLVLVAVLWMPKMNTQAASLYEVQADQVESGRTLEIKVPYASKLISTYQWETVTVTATMSYGDKVMQKETMQGDLKDLVTGSLKLEVPFYGKYSVKAEFKKAGVVKRVSTTTAAVISDSYNIVAMNATTPVLITSLKAWDISKDADGKAIPTIVSLSRAKQYNWDALPENLYTNPYLTETENISAGWRAVKLKAMAAYVADLYELNPDSKFTFYVNDYNLKISLPQLYYENMLPKENCSVRIVTDGSASYNIFTSVYGGTNAQATHDALVEDFKTVRQKIYDGETVDYEKLKYGDMCNYAYAILDVERDAQWWVVRKSTDTFNIPDETFRAKVIADGRVTSNYINNLLASVQSNGHEEAFKALYNFDDTAFQATRAKGKKIMMILGTSKAGETTAPVADYARFVVQYYGDDFEYYYKGHPGWISESDPMRVKELDSLGLQILDSSIAAELFIFYNPDIYISGYQSSTFQNAKVTDESVNNEHFAGLFNTTKEEGHQGGVAVYGPNMDFFLSDLSIKTSLADDKLNGLIDTLGIKADRLFLAEFQFGTYAYAIWDSTTATIYFLDKEEDGSYTVKETNTRVLKSQGMKATKSSVTLVKGKTLACSGMFTRTGDGALSYASSNKKIVSVDAKTGAAKCVGYGTAKITISAAATYRYAAGKVSFTVKVVPGKVTIGKLTGRKKALTVRWKRISGVSGYKIVYARNKSFTKGKKTVTIKSYKTYYKTIRKLRSRVRYYVKVRAYKTVSGKNYYGAYSKVKSIKTK